jgi:BlaI family penicillinase repressor
MAEPRISDAEWEVMEVLWASSPRTAQEIVQTLSPHHDWKDQTIRTMLGRLVKKGAVAAQAAGKAYLYSPAVRRDRCVRGESRSFVQRVLRHAAAPVLVQMVQDTELSRAEIAELRRILKEKEKEKGVKP